MAAAKEAMEKAKALLVKLKHTIGIPKGYNYIYRGKINYHCFPVKGDKKGGIIVGSFEDDMGSIDMVQDTLIKYTPQALILGRMNRRMLVEDTQTAPKYYTDLLAKELMASYVKDFYPFLENDLLSINKKENQYIYHRKDPSLHRVRMMNDLSSSAWALHNPKCNLLFGAPDPVQYIEYLTKNISLEELTYIFNDCVTGYIGVARTNRLEPSPHSFQLMHNLKHFTLTKYSKVLYRKYCEYLSAVIRYTQKQIDLNPLIVVDNTIVHYLHDVYNEESTQNYLEVMVDNKNVSESDLPTLMEKHAILSLILNDGVVKFKEHLPWNIMYNGQFKNRDLNSLFIEKMKPYQNIIDGIMAYEIDRIPSTRGSGRWRLTQYDKEIELYQSKCNYITQYQLEYGVNPTREIQIFEEKSNKVQEQMLYNLYRREQLLEMQHKGRNVLQSYQNNTLTVGEGKILLQMMLEAYIQLGFEIPDYMEPYIPILSQKYQLEFKALTQKEIHINCLKVPPEVAEILLPSKTEIMHTSELIHKAASDMSSLVYSDANERYGELIQRFPHLLSEENALQMSKLIRGGKNTKIIAANTTQREPVKWNPEIQRKIDTKYDVIQDIQPLMSKLKGATVLAAQETGDLTFDGKSGILSNELVNKIKEYSDAVLYAIQNNIDLPHDLVFQKVKIKFDKHNEKRKAKQQN
jgi:hypothetical protein